MIPFSVFSKQFPGVSSIVLGCKRRAPKQEKLIRLHGTPQSLSTVFKTLMANSAEFKGYLSPDRPNSWAGFGPGETPRTLIESGTLPSALAAVKKAAGTLSAPLARSVPQPSFVGPSFSVGRLIQGHPKACYTRPRAKLPPKNIDLYAGYHCGVSAESLSPIFASIARGISDYTLRGGVVTVRLNVLSGFALPNEGHTGLVISVDIPTGNLGALAGVCSVAFDRALNLALAQTLSGQAHDSLPVLTVAEKGKHQITGDPATDRATLAAINISGA
jgi:hypothetical protein